MCFVCACVCNGVHVCWRVRMLEDLALAGHKSVKPWSTLGQPLVNPWSTPGQTLVKLAHPLQYVKYLTWNRRLDMLHDVAGGMM